MNNHKKIGDFPTNARIKISYPEKGDPSIDFEYPDNERQIKTLWASSGIMYIALMITIILLGIFFLMLYAWLPVEYPDCIIKPIGDLNEVIPNQTVGNHTEDIVITRNASSILAVCGANGDTSAWIIRWQMNPILLKPEWSATQPEDIKMIIPVIGFAVIVLIFYFSSLYILGKILAYFVRKTKSGKKHYPRWNKFIHNKHFTAEFKECPDNLQIEIPLFSNIFLDYETEEEFADYLTEVEIKEHDLQYRKTKTFFGLIRKRKQELVPNVYLWKATFKFKKKPTKGFLKVNFT